MVRGQLADPGIERLFEGVAFLNANLQPTGAMIWKSSRDPMQRSSATSRVGEIGARAETLPVVRQGWRKTAPTAGESAVASGFASAVPNFAFTSTR